MKYFIAKIHCKMTEIEDFNETNSDWIHVQWIRSIRVCLLHKYHHRWLDHGVCVHVFVWIRIAFDISTDCLVSHQIRTHNTTAGEWICEQWWCLVYLSEKNSNVIAVVVVVAVVVGLTAHVRYVHTKQDQCVSPNHYISFAYVCMGFNWEITTYSNLCLPNSIFGSYCFNLSVLEHCFHCWRFTFSSIYNNVFTFFSFHSLVYQLARRFLFLRFFVKFVLYLEFIDILRCWFRLICFSCKDESLFLESDLLPNRGNIWYSEDKNDNFANWITFSTIVAHKFE